MHLLRCGSTGGGEMRPYVGQKDLPLCPEGEEALHALRRACEYPRVQTVFTSPQQRCVRTAEILYPDHYTVPMPGLIDLGLGDFEGKTVADLQERDDFKAWIQNSRENPPPGGELLEEFTERIVRSVRDIFVRMMEEQLRSVAVITHGGVIMSLLAGIGLPKAPMQQWATPGGTGYTLLFTPQMWMQSGCAEIFAHQPTPLEECE